MQKLVWKLQNYIIILSSSTPQPLCEHTMIKTIHHVNKTSKTHCEVQNTVVGSLQPWRIDSQSKAGGTVFANLCAAELPQWTRSASDGAVWPAEPPTGPRQHRHPTLWPTHMCAAHAHAPLWTRSTSAQRNSFSNFPWLRKQYTCLNNVDISNALKHSSNGALIGCKWIQDGKHSEGDPTLYRALLDL